MRHARPVKLELLSFTLSQATAVRLLVLASVDKNEWDGNRVLLKLPAGCIARVTFGKE